MCHQMNSENDGQMIVGYSSDAGFHVFLFVLKENTQKVKDRVNALKIGNTDEPILETLI